MTWLTNNWPYVLILFGALLSAVGAFTASFNQSRFEREMRTRSDRALERAEETIKSITGGDSIVYAEAMQWNNDSRSFWLNLVCEGRYPVYDIEVQLEDISKRMQLLGDAERLKRLGPRVIEETISAIAVGNMRSGTLRMRWIQVRIPDGVEWYGINVVAHARNGSTTTRLRFSQQGERFSVARWIYKGDPHTIQELALIRAHVPEGWPRAQDGQPIQNQDVPKG